jgi:hypothetical protein
LGVGVQHHRGIVVEPRDEPAQPAMRRDSHRARAFTHDPSDLGGVKSGHHAQEDYLGLIAGQRSDER